MTTQAEFFETHAVDGQLTDAQMMELLQLPEGDMPTPPVAEANSGTPDAASTEQATPDTAQAVAPTTTTAPTDVHPTILAKDGVHTIPYDKLVEAREAEKQWRAQAEAAQQQLAEMQAKLQQQTASATPEQLEKQAEDAISKGVDPSLFGDFSEEAIAAGVQKLVDARVAAIEARLSQVVAPLQQAAQVSEAEQARNLVLSKHPDAASIAESAELDQWVQSKPAFVRGAYQQVIAGGTPDQVVELLDAFKSETRKSQPETTAKTAAQAAKEAIANAQTRTPSSLSDIPGGMPPVTNSAEALASMSINNQIDKFSNLSPDQIWELVDKLS